MQVQFTDLLLDQLEKIGCKAIFGIPGDFVLPLLRELQHRARLPFYSLNHEPAAVFAADAAARIGRAPGVALLTYGAGALNAVNAIAQAYVERVPVVILAGFPAQAEISRGIAIHHQAKDIDSQRRILSEVTAMQVRLDNPTTAATDLRAALQCCQQNSRPVLIEIPRDAIAFDCPLPVQLNQPAPKTPLPQALQQLITRRLEQARRPVLLAGIEVQRFAAADALEHLALQLNLPVITTFLARAAIAPDHPCLHGTFIDESDQDAYHLLLNSDLIIHVGVIINDNNFASYPQFARGDNVIHLHQGDCTVDGKLFTNVDLAHLCENLLLADLPRFETWFTAAPTKSVDSSGKWQGAAVVELIDRQLAAQPQTVPLISDVGDCLFASLHARASQVLAPAYYASMGYAIPAALGAQLASGLRPVVLVGDGAFLMTGLELSQLVKHGATPIVVLFNNRSWDMIEAFSPGLSCSALPGCDISRLAAAQGAVTYHANDAASFTTAFKAAWSDPGALHFIEVQLVRQRTPRLQRFAQRFVQSSSL